jgi:hypothetical protein
MGACRVNYWFRCPHGSNKTTPTTSAIAPMARRRADRPIVPTKAPTTTVWVPETVRTTLDLLLRRQPATGMIRRWRSR